MAVLELPIRADLPAYDFTVELDGTVYTLALRYNERMARWIMDLMTSDGVQIISGIPLLTNCDLIGRFRYNIVPPGKFLAYDTSGNDANAERLTFGEPIVLLYEELII